MKETVWAPVLFNFFLITREDGPIVNQLATVGYVVLLIFKRLQNKQALALKKKISKH